MLNRRYFFFIGALIALIHLPGSAAESEPELGELQWADRGFLEKHRDLVDQLSRVELGRRIRQDHGDIETLQLILDKGLVKPLEAEKLQALGVVLGDVFVSDLKLEWRTYTDDYGKSRAVCLPRTEYCLFPVTMISKRVSRGVKVNVAGVYEKALGLIDPYLPKTPYSSNEKK